METKNKIETFIHLVHNNHMKGFEAGWGNGYVNIPQDHPWYGKDYNDIECSNIHGGLTYSQKEGEFWVIGFDTCHYGDTPENWPKHKVYKEAVKLKKMADEAMKIKMTNLK